MATQYAAKVQNWLTVFAKDYSNYMPSNFPLNFAFSGMGDQEIRNYAKLLYNTVVSNYHTQSQKAAPHQHDDYLHLVPYESRDGSVTWYDRSTGNVVAGIIKQSNGLFSYFGSDKLLETLGGRGKLSQIYKNMEDSKFFKDTAPAVQQK